MHELCKFTFEHKQFRIILGDYVSVIYKICFNFLRFEKFDIEKLKTDPMNLLLDVEYIVEEHVSSAKRLQFFTIIG